MSERPPPCAEGYVVADGVCVRARDAGPRDAGFDAGVEDAGHEDAGSVSLDANVDASDGPLDAGVDAGPPGLDVGDSLRIDFGPTAATGWWAHADREGSTGPVPSVGGATTGSFVVTEGFTGEQTGGSVSNSLGLPGQVSSDTLWVGSFDGHDVAVTLRATAAVTALPEGAYTLVVFASRTGNDGALGRLTRFTVAGTSQDLEVADNTANAITFEDVAPDDAGSLQVEITVSPDGTGRFAYLGSLEITRTR
ncbi:MAG: hypothetical protein H6721_25185 [Sandaracinus sp.]|nr:hypothetical protein [Sandaracinus sp.]